MREAPILAFLFLCALVTIVTTVGIVIVLLAEAFQFFREVSIVEFLTGTEWTPLFSIKNFGVLPLLSATVLISFLALTIAVPVGLLTAIYLSEYAPEYGAVCGKTGARGACGHPYGGVRILCDILHQPEHHPAPV